MIHIHDNTDNEPYRTMCGNYARKTESWLPTLVEPENKEKANCPECLKAVAETHGCEIEHTTNVHGVDLVWRCPAPAKVVRDGKHYCSRHDPVRIAERRKKRDRKWQERQDKLVKTYGFRVDNLRIYEIPALSETEAKAILVDRILEVKIECLGEVKK